MKEEVKWFEDWISRQADIVAKILEKIIRRTVEKKNEIYSYIILSYWILNYLIIFWYLRRYLCTYRSSYLQEIDYENYFQIPESSILILSYDCTWRSKFNSTSRYRCLNTFSPFFYDSSFVYTLFLIVTAYTSLINDEWYDVALSSYQIWMTIILFMMNLIITYFSMKISSSISNIRIMHFLKSSYTLYFEMCFRSGMSKFMNILILSLLWKNDIKLHMTSSLGGKENKMNYIISWFVSRSFGRDPLKSWILTRMNFLYRLENIMWYFKRESNIGIQIFWIKYLTYNFKKLIIINWNHAPNLHIRF